jgi:hypothetical protein
MVPAEDYRHLIERLDETTLAQAFIGRWASREAFGLHLLADTGAAARIAALPRWLRGYVRLDGDAYAAELEDAGIYVVASVESGVCVFDASVARPKE